MTEIAIKKYISDARFNKYSSFDEYQENLILSKQFYIPLSILEVSLRNAIDSYFVNLYGHNWLLNEAQFLQRDALEKIFHAKAKLSERRENITHAKLTAELTLGFWTSLFQKPYDKTMRLQTLKGIFSNLPKQEVKFIDRKIISAQLNHIRKFRNRIFHFEKVINKEEFNTIQNDIDEVLYFLNNDVYEFVKRLNS
ncbi:hypothetical protein [Sulfuricurvum sp.]|uniref:hypothetical protein n=1 Tax=Sulfuricurvum sp. TaxID=2025608 RepID=UPI00286EA0F8|nr:hypothetical protein [Sulfuricurvum sp.]